jgi:hypothetical protein
MKKEYTATRKSKTVNINLNGKPYIGAVFLDTKSAIRFVKLLKAGDSLAMQAVEIMRETHKLDEPTVSSINLAA